MDFFIATAAAQQGAEGAAGDLVFFVIFTGFLIAIFYFLLIRPQRKRMKEHQELLKGLNEGDEVVTNGGELGRVTRVDDQFIRLEVAPGVVWSVKRDYISNVMPAGTVAEQRERGSA